MSAQKSFHWKVFVSFYVLLSFITLSVSGIVLYVAPPGRIANWSVWKLVALNKGQWQAMHTIFALLFLVAAGFHLYFNWKVLMAYLKSKLTEGIRMKWELGSATSVAALVFVLSVAAVPPFSTIMTAGENIKNSWATTANEPPVPHAELLTIEKLADTVKLPADKVLESLQQQGFAAEAGQTVKQIADRNHVTPQQVYKGLESTGAKPQPSFLEGGGWGRMTIAQVCEKAAVTVDTGLERLRAQGIETEASASLREVATAHGKTPVDLAKIVAAIPADAAAPTTTTHRPGAGRGQIER